MHQHHEVQHLTYSPEQMFDLVLDIERYPEFLPWCRAARILERGENRLLAELVISFSRFTESYVSEVTFTPAQEIHVKLVRGPFEYLSNDWRFAPEGEGCEITLDLAFKFRSKILDSLIGMMFEKACAKMAAAFTARAHQLYGKKS